MKKGVTEEQIRNVVQKLEQIGARGHVSVGEFRTVIGAIGDDAKIAQLPLEAFPGVESVMPICLGSGSQDIIGVFKEILVGMDKAFLLRSGHGMATDKVHSLW
uniref:hypothetical protein n=1 Tax=Candidatus Hakubella thermalkaliphila TaxID=2754717 RepID=UPI00387E82FA